MKDPKKTKHLSKNCVQNKTIRDKIRKKFIKM